MVFFAMKILGICGNCPQTAIDLVEKLKGILVEVPVAKASS
jgi:hypothetical protein